MPASPKVKSVSSKKEQPTPSKEDSTSSDYERSSEGGASAQDTSKKPPTCSGLPTACGDNASESAAGDVVVAIDSDVAGQAEEQKSE